MMSMDNLATGKEPYMAEAENTKRTADILIVDDDNDFQVLLKDIFHNHREKFNNTGISLSIHTVETGDGAFEFIQKKKPDLILLDQRLPGMDGFSILEKIKTDIPVIFLTNLHDENFRSKVLELGAYDFIRKEDIQHDLVIKTRNALLQILQMRELKKTQEALQKSEEKYRALIENSDDCICLIDLDLNISLMSSGGVKLNKFTGPDEAVGKSALAGIKEEYRNIMEDALEKAKKGEESRVNYESVNKTGEEICWESNVSPIKNHEGRIVNLMRISRDITERKYAVEALQESEEKFRSLFEESKDVIFIADTKGEIMDMNRAGIDLFGYTKEEIQGMDLRKISADKDGETRLLEDIEEKGFVKDFEVRLKKKDGTFLECLLCANPWKDRNGTIIGLQGIIRDITHEKLIQQQLIQSEKLSSVGTFVSGVAHELNNPLTIVMGFAQSLLQNKRNVLPEDIQHNLEVISEASERTVSIVRNLLKFSRRYKPGKATISIREVLEGTINLQESQMKASNIKIVKDYADNFCHVHADQNQLQQVFMNIIVNAIHAMKKCKEKNIFTMKTVLEENDVVITFENTGSSIPEESIGKIFDPFYTTKKVGEGTGLGLYVSYGIIKDHNGKMWVENVGNSGVRFSITLQTAHKELEKSDREEDLTLPDNLRLLFVEDEEQIREWFSSMFDNEKISIDLKENSEDAKEALDGTRYDVIISDMKMTGKNGLELGEWLQEEMPEYQNRFILATGALDPEVDEYCSRYQWECVRKPFDKNKLIQAIQKVLKKTELHDIPA